eukprot:TRINITY_DN1896_c0_g1_i1.p1 TRINITY_DN1896_c0_g1~~TRINITY_DN1896_c0_g1_i1.p1  ORF type:complete len:500 (+),score=119.43 TRINITY_DN1896_c0_g1_i1:53-1552(+)
MLLSALSLVAACVSVGVGWVLLVEINKRFFNHPPGPVPVPVLGNLLSFGGGKSPLDVVNRWIDKYGPVMQFYAFSSRIIVLSSPEAVKEAFVTQSQRFSNRIPLNVPEFHLHEGVAFADGSVWRDNRKYVSQWVIKDVQKKDAMISEEVHETIKEIVKQGDSGRKPVLLRQTLKSLSFSVVCRLILGDNMRTGEKKALGERFLESNTWVVNNGILLFSPFVSTFKKIPFLNRFYLEFSRRFKILHGVVLTLLEEHEKSFDAENLRDFLDLFVSLRKTGSIPEGQIAHTTADAFSGGADTTALTIEWLILFLASHPDVQDKVHHELDQVVGRSRVPTAEDLTKLPFLNAAIMEVMRLKPVTPIGVPHYCTESTRVCGVLIPKGSIILTGVHHIQSDLKLWTDPTSFRPERFLEEEKNRLDLKATEARNSTDEYRLIPFGVGKRACVGFPLAKLELSLIAMHLCQNFNFSFAEGHQPDLRGFLGLIYEPLVIQSVIFSPRL